MRKSCLHVAMVALLGILWSAGISTPLHAETGSVAVVFTKGDVILGVGGGEGVLTLRGRHYPFTVQGLSLGLTAGASVNKLVGRASYLHELRDFEGTYIVVGAGGALLGGVGGVQLKNAKGVILTLQGPKAGVELSANVTKVVITLD